MRTQRLSRRCHRPAFMLLDVMVGIGLLIVILGVLSAVIAHEHQAAASFAETRRATRAAEAALSELQAGRAAHTAGATEDVSVQVRYTASPAAPAGHRWVEVEATAGRSRSVLVGLVPEERAAP